MGSSPQSQLLWKPPLGSHCQGQNPRKKPSALSMGHLGLEGQGTAAGSHLADSRPQQLASLQFGDTIIRWGGAHLGFCTGYARWLESDERMSLLSVDTQCRVCEPGGAHSCDEDHHSDGPAWQRIYNCSVAKASSCKPCVTVSRYGTFLTDVFKWSLLRTLH